MNETNTNQATEPEIATETTETVIEPKAEEQVYTCAGCRREATANDGVVVEMVNGKDKIVDATMWAAAGEVGSENKLEIFCKKCAADGEEDGQVFFPLKNALAYAERVAKHFPKRERLLEQAKEPEMRVPRPEMVCKRCGRKHGQIDNYRGGVTIVRKAIRIDFNQKPIIAEFLCGDCLKALGLLPKKNPDGSFTQPEGLYSPWKTLQMARDAEDQRLDRLERQAEAKERRAKQRQLDDEIRQQATAPRPAPTARVIFRPNARPGSGSLRNHANRKDGTRD